MSRNTSMKNASSTFREGLLPYRQPRPRRLPSKNRIAKAKGSDWKSVVKQVVDATKFVVSMINTENKICDTYDARAYNATNTAVIPISLMAQGSDFVQRIGAEIHPKQLDLRFAVYKSLGSIPGFCRLIILRDNNCNGATPSVSDVLTLVGNAPLSHYNYFNFQGDDMPRFTIFMDELFAIAPSSDQNQIHETSIKLPEDSHIHYLGPTAVATSQGKGSLFAVVVCDTTATDTFAAQLNTRLNFLSY